MINIFNIHNAGQVSCPGSKAMRKWLGTSWYLVAVPALVIPFSSPSFFPCVLVFLFQPNIYLPPHPKTFRPSDILTKRLLWSWNAIACLCFDVYQYRARCHLAGKSSPWSGLVPPLKASHKLSKICFDKIQLKGYEVSFAFIVLIWLTVAQSFGDDLLMPRLMRKYARHPVVVGDVIQQI